MWWYIQPKIFKSYILRCKSLPKYPGKAIVNQYQTLCISLSPRNLSHPARKLTLWTMRKVSTRISLIMPHRRIQTDTFRLLWIFCFRNHYTIPLSHWNRMCWPGLACASPLCWFSRGTAHQGINNWTVPNSFTTEFHKVDSSTLKIERHHFSCNRKFRYELSLMNLLCLQKPLIAFGSERDIEFISGCWLKYIQV